MLYINWEEVAAATAIYSCTIVIVTWRFIKAIFQAREAIRDNLMVLSSNFLFIVSLVLRVAWIIISFPYMPLNNAQNILTILSDSIQCLALALYIQQWFSVSIFKDIVLGKFDKILKKILYSIDGLIVIETIGLIVIECTDVMNSVLICNTIMCVTGITLSLMFILGGSRRMKVFTTSLPDPLLVRRKRIPLAIASFTAITTEFFKQVFLLISDVERSVAKWAIPLVAYAGPDCVLALVLVLSFGQ